jgi:hypothetical protein
VRENAERALGLSAEVGTAVQAFAIAYALWFLHAIRADMAASAVAAKLNDLAQGLGTPESRLEADSVLLRTAVYEGRFADARRIAASHMVYSGRLLPVGPSGNEYCIDMLDPYDFTGSSNYSPASGSLDQCVERGFALQTSVTSWRGNGAVVIGTADVATSDQIVKTGSSITAFDDFGRVTDSMNLGDLRDNNDDLCVHVDYATPQTAPVRVGNESRLRSIRSRSHAQGRLVHGDQFRHPVHHLRCG